MSEPESVTSWAAAAVQSSGYAALFIANPVLERSCSLPSSLRQSSGVKHSRATRRREGAVAEVHIRGAGSPTPPHIHDLFPQTSQDKLQDISSFHRLPTRGKKSASHYTGITTDHDSWGIRLLYRKKFNVHQCLFAKKAGNMHSFQESRLLVWYVWYITYCKKHENSQYLLTQVRIYKSYVYLKSLLFHISWDKWYGKLLTMSEWI